MAGLGTVFARKANAAKGPTEIIVPMGGFSVPDAPGGAFWDPEADGAFLGALRDNIASHVSLTVLDEHINDDAFIDHVVGVLTATLQKQQQVHPPAFA
jgi:uncharacterized protein (UPF0261 family)